MRRFSFHILPWLLFCALGLQPVEGRAETGAERGSQFVFVIDDSGSMAREIGGLPAADPDRLAVFAVRSLVAMLDDSDEVALVRLNGPSEGEEPVPLVALRRGRRQVEERLALTAPLARYDGQNTPCRRALDSAGQILERGYRQGTPQVLVMLTDGDCNQGDIDPEGFLGQLPAHREGLFQLFLLRFRGRPFAPALQVLAERSDGQVIEVGSEDPAALLEPFADALTRSQGYEAELLTPASHRLTGHQGAHSLRLLAVTRGEGPPLTFEIEGAAAGAVPGLAAPTHGTHRWAEGEVFRYATAEVRPGSGDLDVRVAGAARGWKIVAVPDYRLAVRLEVGQGLCETRESRGDHVEAGETLCVVLSVVGESGRAVVGDWVRGGLEARLRLSRQALDGGSAPDSGSVLIAEGDGDRAEFFFERPSLEEGTWVLQPLVGLRLGGPGAGRVLPAGLRTVLVSSVRVEVTPREVDFGTLVPGRSAAGEPLRLTGNFPPTAGRLEPLDPAAVPLCVAFRLGEAEQGERVPVAQGQRLVPGVRVGPYCGPESFDQSYSVPLRLVLDRAGDRDFPSPTLLARFRLVSEIRIPGQQQIRLPAGETRKIELEIATNAARAQELEARLIGPGNDGSWPGGLTWTLADAGILRLDPARGEAAVLAVDVAADACCGRGPHVGRLELRPVGATPGLAAVEIPISVEVVGRGWWACRGPWIVRGLLAAVLLLLLLYLVSMVRNSSFLSREHLAASLVPLRWDPYGAVERDPRPQLEMLAMVRAGLGWSARALAWLRANPLVFGLPGRRYRETVELQLQPERQLDRSRVRLVGGREHLEGLQEQPGPGLGRLFARATGGRQHTFYSVPKNGTRIGRLVPEQRVDQVLYGDPDEEAAEPSRVVSHKKRQRLIHPISEKEREEGRAAGWQLG